jgi:release factor glutamine methyltransferase
MTTSYWLNTATHFLQSKSITTARLDALILLEDTIGKNRAQLLAEPTMEMKDAWVAHLQKLLIRRSRHEPLAYIRGFSEFYGRKFVINSSVLEPRPESETLIELLLELPLFRSAEGSNSVLQEHTAHANKTSSNRPTIADIGTGSGALGITAALQLPDATVDLLELDPAAAKVAQFNVDRLTTGLRVILSDLLDSTDAAYDVLICNLPYVPDDYAINKAATFEPVLALFGGPDGLDLYRKLFSQLSAVQKRPLFILTESLPQQHDSLKDLARENGYELDKTADFIQQFSQI